MSNKNCWVCRKSSLNTYRKDDSHVLRERCVCQSRNVKDFLTALEARKGKGWLYPVRFRERIVLWTSGFQTLSLQDGEKINVYCFWLVFLAGDAQNTFLAWCWGYQRVPGVKARPLTEAYAPGSPPLQISMTLSHQFAVLFGSPTELKPLLS